MAIQYVCTACHGNIKGNNGGDTERRASEGADRFADQMNTYSGTNSYDTYGYSGFGLDYSHNWHPSTADFKSDGSDKSESEYIDDLATEIGQADKNDEIIVSQGDVWIVSDAYEQYGYGRSEIKTVDT